MGSPYPTLAVHSILSQIKDGVRLFEISDVVLRDDASDTGARNCRRLVATYMGPTAGFEIIHGLVDRIMSLVQVWEDSIERSTACWFQPRYPYSARPM